MANGYYAPFYRGNFFNMNPPVPQTPDAMNFAPQQSFPQYPTSNTPTSDMLWVLNENEASSYPVVPGNTVILWDKNEPTIYVKSADAHGVPSMRILDFKERPQNASQGSQRRDSTEEGKYVSAEAFSALTAEFEELRAKVTSLSEKSAKEENK